jgi:hypothetical protein
VLGADDELGLEESLGDVLRLGLEDGHWLGLSLSSVQNHVVLLPGPTAHSVAAHEQQSPLLAERHWFSLLHSSPLALQVAPGIPPGQSVGGREG